LQAQKDLGTLPLNAPMTTGLA